MFPGTTVTYTYTAQNTGTADLRNDTGTAGWVTDDQCPGVVQVLDGTGDNVGDSNGDGLLNPAEIWEFTCSKAIAALTINVATITAQPVDSGGAPIGAPLERHAEALVRVVQPGIGLVKTALRPVVLDADANPIAGPDVPTPRTADYTYDVANTGTTPLDDVILSDPLCAAIVPTERPTSVTSTATGCSTSKRCGCTRARLRWDVSRPTARRSRATSRGSSRTPRRVRRDTVPAR